MDTGHNVSWRLGHHSPSHHNTSASSRPDPRGYQNYYLRSDSSQWPAERRQNPPIRQQNRQPGSTAAPITQQSGWTTINMPSRSTLADRSLPPPNAPTGPRGTRPSPGRSRAAERTFKIRKTPTRSRDTVAPPPRLQLRDSSQPIHSSRGQAPDFPRVGSSPFLINSSNYYVFDRILQQQPLLESTRQQGSDHQNEEPNAARQPRLRTNLPTSTPGPKPISTPAPRPASPPVIAARPVVNSR